MDLLNLFQEDLTTDLTDQETALLNECEAVVLKGIKAFKEVWGALLEIRDSKLYRKEFRTFEDYCVVKWDLSRDYVNKNIRALGVLNNLDTMVSNEITERQLRPLTNLEPEIQRQVVKEAQEINPKAPTSLIQDVVNQYGGVNAVLKELKLNPDLVFESEQDLINKAKSLLPAPAPVVQEVIKHVEIIKDESLKAELEQSKDTISELQKRIVDQASNYSKVQNKLIDYENKISEFDKKIKEIETLKSKLSEYEDVKNAMLQINELEKKKSDLFKHSQKVKDILEVLDSSRKFFNQNVLALGTIQLDNGIKESLQTQVIELINIIDSWKFALSNNLLLEQSLIGG